MHAYHASQIVVLAQVTQVQEHYTYVQSGTLDVHMGIPVLDMRCWEMGSIRRWRKVKESFGLSHMRGHASHASS